MAALGPFEPAPLLAVGVSGGADSMALAWLADRWARACGGRIICLIVDHGLRPEAADEASHTAAHLMSQGIAAEILRLDGLKPGPDLAARARAGRYAALEAACAARGALHLLVAHHAADQAETIVMRMLAASQSGHRVAAIARMVAQRTSHRAARSWLAVGRGPVKPRPALAAGIAARVAPGCGRSRPGDRGVGHGGRASGTGSRGACPRQRR